VIRATRTLTVETYTSSILTDVSTQSESLAEVIAWADLNPVVWKVVTQNRSRAFGKSSSHYIGWAQGKDDPEAVLERARSLREEVQAPDHGPFWKWRARFTLEHYGHRGFRGDLFSQWDGKYARGCAALDYTPATLDEVCAEFRRWCARSPLGYRTREVRIGDKAEKAIWVAPAGEDAEVPR
jgi:hypothetical protein